MGSFIEGVGVTLGIIALLQYDLRSYARAWNNLTLFLEPKYSNQVEFQKSRLNSMTLCLKDVVDLVLGDLPEPTASGKVFDHLDDPQSEIWKDPALEARFRTRLGEGCSIFCDMMNQAQKLTKELTARLEANTCVTSANESNPYLQRIGLIFSNGLLGDELDRLETLINGMKELADRPIGLYGNARFELLLARKRQARELAGSFQRALLLNDCWDCHCEDGHHIHFILPSKDEARESPTKISLRVSSPATVSQGQTAAPKKWHHIEVESLPSPTNRVVETEQERESTRVQRNESSSATSEVSIANLCVALTNLNVEGQREKIGYIGDGHCWYQISVDKIMAESLRFRSLEEILKDLLTLPAPDTAAISLFLNRKVRLQLSLQLACSVFKYQGNWLRARWSGNDIMFLEDDHAQKEAFKHPFLTWNVPSRSGLPNSTVSSVDLGQALRRLGSTLISISLKMANVELDNFDAWTAARSIVEQQYLQSVEKEEGSEYAAVVKRCLKWSQTHNTTQSEEAVQGEVFESIIWPLLNMEESF